MERNLDKVKQQARDLRKVEPRSPDEELGGYPVAARCLDICRATLVGWQGEYTYGCSTEHEFLDGAGIDAEEFKEFVASGATDAEVADWLRQRAVVN
jgi:Domain of unknown function (DUF5069)